MNAKDLSIIILTKNGGDLFKDALAGLFACDGILEAEVLVIDSGSGDGTLDYVKNYPHIRIHRIPSSEFGHGKTRNLGARMTSGPIIVYLVQDATPATSDFLTWLTNSLGEEDFAGVFGRQVPRPSTNRIERIFLESTYPDHREVRAYSNQAGLGIRSIFFSNVCSAIRRDIWERIPFDESLIMSEDQLWAKQVLLAGHRILYEPHAMVFHSHNYGLKDVFKRNFDSGASLVGIAEDTFGRMASYEAQHLALCVRELARSGDLKLSPYLLAYEVTRATAFTAGQRAHLLPLWVKRMLSLHRYHWQDHQASIGSTETPAANR
jgi:rhamnosyltransferase